MAVHAARGVSLREAWSWESAGPGRLTARSAAAPQTPVETTSDAFADRFVEENFA